MISPASLTSFPQLPAVTQPPWLPQGSLGDLGGELVLVGGGHSHALVLRQWAMAPLAGVRVTLISDRTHTPYSGMLPGYVAGFYGFEECHIDLRRLAQAAGAQFYHDRVIGLDLAQNQVLCGDRPPVAFHWLSLDVGSTPQMDPVPGAAAHATPIKPIPEFLRVWEAFLGTLEPQDDRPRHIGIVGGGAGGVELTLALGARLWRWQHQHDLTWETMPSRFPSSDDLPQKAYPDLWHRWGQSWSHGNPKGVAPGGNAQRLLAPPGFTLHLFHRDKTLMTGHSPAVRQLFQDHLTQGGVQVHQGRGVVAVEGDPTRPQGGIVVQESGERVPCDRIFWVTQASAPSWIRAAGLTTDDRGFVAVGPTLQSLSHPQVFAAGDVAHMVDYPRPKAGVFAVRQGKPLFHNLQALCRQNLNLSASRAGIPQPFQGQTALVPYIPQEVYLALVGDGHGRAAFSWGPLGWGFSRSLWLWKDRLDRQFMEQFTRLSPMPRMSSAMAPPSRATGFPQPGILPWRLPAPPFRLGFRPPESSPNPPASGSPPRPWADWALRETPDQAPPWASIRRPESPPTPRPRRSSPRAQAPCAGCGSKVGANSLGRVFQRLGSTLTSPKNPTIALGLQPPDDGAILRWPQGLDLVQTVDFFRALVSDPFIFGQILANHCLNDLFAMGATPHSVLALVTLPYGSPPSQEETLYQLLSGILRVMQPLGVPVVGGHTTLGTELAAGLTCNGSLWPQHFWSKGKFQPGHALILTKPLGTGTLFAAAMEGEAQGHWLDGAIASMIQCHGSALDILRNHGTTACTDITGFGLLGHLAEVVQASQVGIRLEIDRLPILPGARQSLQGGWVSSLHGANAQAQCWLDGRSLPLSAVQLGLLCDPQTSGGLLAAVPIAQVQSCLRHLHQAGYESSTAIGLVQFPFQNQPSILVV